jgi:hypothetical protein
MLALLMQLNLDGDTLNGINKIFESFGVVQTVLIFCIVLFIWGCYRLIYTWGMNKFSERALEKDRRIDELTKILADSAKTEILNNKKYLIMDDFKNLENHPLFQNINYWLAVRINQMNMSDNNKSNIFKDYVTIRYTAVKKNWIAFIRDNNISELTRNELKVILIDTLIKITKDIKENIEVANFPETALVEMEKSAQIIDKIVISAIESFTTSEHFENGFDVLYTLLTIKMHILEVVFYELVMSLEKLNGSLQNQTYTPKFYKN